MQPRTSRDTAKLAAARAAVDFVVPGIAMGVGTGSTVAQFIQALGASGIRPLRAVSTSRDTDERMRAVGLVPLSLSDSDRQLDLYVDGADEVDASGRAIKGGGGAHTREKAVAQASRTWVCIVDDEKVVTRLGSRAPVPVEVEAAALTSVSDALAGLGGRSSVRAGHVTDSGNPIIDTVGLDLSDPAGMETLLEAIPGVLACGIFARRPADVLVVGHADGSVSMWRPERD